MSEEIIQVGRFFLKKREGFESFDARQRLLAVRMRRPKRSPVPMGCKNPDEDWGLCRALTHSSAGANRCSKGRQFLSFFCGMHDPLEKIGNGYSAAWKPIIEILNRIGFRGNFEKYGKTYTAEFLKRPAKDAADLLDLMSSGLWFRFETDNPRVNSVRIRDWVEIAMKAEEMAYSPMHCVRCLRKFRIIDGIGHLSDIGQPVCGKCRKAYYEEEYPKKKKAMKALDEIGAIFKAIR